MSGWIWPAALLIGVALVIGATLIADGLREIAAAIREGK
jgi:hypothetical protein